MCVCMHIEPAKTATGSIARSSASTDHTASTNTNHHSTGRYGFHGSVSRNAPYARVNTASTAATPSSSARPPRRTAIHSASPIATMSSTTVDANKPYDEPPNSFHTGQSA